MPRLLPWTLNLLLLLASLALTGGVFELGLRLVPNSWRLAYESGREGGSTVRYRSGLDGGLYTLEPGQQGARFRRDCFDVRQISTNQNGFRGPVWPSRNGVFLLGDSFVEGLQVAESDTAAVHLASMLGEPVGNAGISGYSTVTELLAYTRFLRPLRPRLVLLAFYLGNDVAGNSCRLGGRQAACGRGQGDDIRFMPDHGGRPEPGNIQPLATAGDESGANGLEQRARRWLMRHFVLYYFLHDIKLITQGAIGQLLGSDAKDRWKIYLDPPPAEIDEAWRYTEKALADLKSEAAKDGARLVVVSIPESFVLNPNWRNQIMFGGGSAVPGNFDPLTPSRRLADLTRKLDLPLIDLLPAFESYRARHSLEFPYFSYACDGHWNPLAHALAARVIAKDLALIGLYSSPAPPPDADPGAPIDVLGVEAYRQIFGGGVYHADKP